jgi:hypothetical protein
VLGDRSSGKGERRAVGLLAILGSALYFLSDVIEVHQGRFSTVQLSLTLVAESAVPVTVVGLAMVQRPVLDGVGRIAAVLYAYSFVFFTGTVVFALVHNTTDCKALTHQLGLWMFVHGAVMVLAGVGFGYETLRAHLLPSWASRALIIGVILVALTQNAAEPIQLAAAGTRDLAFAGMGASLCRNRQLRRPDAAVKIQDGDAGVPTISRQMSSCSLRLRRSLGHPHAQNS